VLIEQAELAACQPELTDPHYAFWLFPFQADPPEQCVRDLWEVGVDSSRYGSLAVVEAPNGRSGLDCPAARNMLNRTVFVPCYPEIRRPVLERAARVLARYRIGREA
jgi:hypothetical protein